MENGNLTYDTIINAGNIESLQKIYQEQGKHVSSLDLFVKQVELDWRQALSTVRQEALSKPVPTQLPYLKVVVGDRTYRIYGITHDPVLKDNYTSLITNALKTNDNWLYEQALGFFVKQSPAAQEIADYTASETSKSLKVGLTLGITLPLFTTWYAKRFLRRSHVSKSTIQELNIPLEARGKLPTYVEIETLDMNNKPYDDTLKRSAYQAAFIKAFNPDKDKSLLVGASHAPQNKYFLQHGIKDNRITDLASLHAEILNNDPNEYIHLLKKSYRKEALVIGLGVALGSSPYWLSYAALFTLYFQMMK